MTSKTKLLTAMLAAAAFAFAGSPKIAKDLEKVSPATTVDVIVQFRQQPTAVHHQRVAARGGNLRQILDLVNAGHYSLPAGALAALAEDPDVAYVSPNRKVQATNFEYAPPVVFADIARNYGWNGSGIGVAVIDSGIDNKHPDLQDGKVSRIVYAKAFASDGGTFTFDKNGHGPHVAGILAGNGAGSTGSQYTFTFTGIAPKVNLINLRVLDANGSGTDSNVISAIQHAVQLKSSYNIRVINLSVGRPVFESYKTDPLCQAVEAAWNAGIVVVVAAGNDGRNNDFGTHGYAMISSPGNDPYVITVGSTKTLGTVSRADDLITSYSAKGPTAIDHIVKPDIVAPGNRIASLVAQLGNFATLYPGNIIPLADYRRTSSSKESSQYYKLSGSSMAAPVVAGAAALLLQKDPSLTPDAVKARLMKTASKTFPSFSTTVDPVTNQTFYSQYDIFTVGAGYLDIWAALNNSDVVNGSALSPVAVYDPSSGRVTIQNIQGVSGTTALWGSSALWGTSAVWGTQVFVGSSSALWGSSAVWGTSTMQGFTAVWGNTALWGTASNSPAATSITSSEPIRIAIEGEN